MDEMSHCSYLTIFSLSSFIIIIIILVVPNANHPLVNAQPVDDLVDTTCKRCASKSPVIDHSFCLASLQSIPTSNVTDLQGLVFAVIYLSIRDITTTVSVIEEMIHIGDYDPFASGCLKDCQQLYSNAVSLLANAVDALINGHYYVANIRLSAVMESSTTCEGGFYEKDGQVSPLTKENYSVFQLSDVALCITNLLSQATASVSS